MAGVLPASSSTTAAVVGAPSSSVPAVVDPLAAVTTTTPIVPAATVVAPPISVASTPATSTASRISTSAVIPSSTVPLPAPPHSSPSTTFYTPTPGGNLNGAANSNGSGHGGNNLNIIIPIATIACLLVIFYVLYRLYLLHKRHKQEVTPLPPPRTPAIFERPQSMLYTGPQMFGQGAGAQGGMNVQQAYRQSMRPVSFMYDPGTSSSSLYKGLYTSSGSGHSTPTHPGQSLDDSTLPALSPGLEPRPFRGGARPHSVASFGSMRGSMYAGSTLRNSPYSSGGIILPSPLAPGAFAANGSHPPVAGRSNRYSMFNAASEVTRGEMAAQELGIRPPSRATSLADVRAAANGRSLTPTLPAGAEGAPRLTLPQAIGSEDWTERFSASVDAEVESNSTCTAHQHPARQSSPPPPVPEKPRNLTPQPLASNALRDAPSAGRAGSTTPSSFSAHMPGGFPASPSPRARSVSPPEPLLNGAFVSSSGSSESK